MTRHEAQIEYVQMVIKHPGQTWTIMETASGGFIVVRVA